MAEVRVHEVSFDDPIDFADALDPVLGLFVGPHLYRGHADSGWPLSPSVFRDNIPYLLPQHMFPPQHRVYGSQVKLEIELLWLFVARANAAGLTIPGDSERVREYLDSIRNDNWWVAEPRNLRTWPSREIIPALALAQHHGVPTRLLDWTYGSRVAIYFAAEGAARRPDRSGRLAVWVCAPKKDGVSVVGAPSLEIARPSNAFNPNLQAQRGCFTVWRKGAAPQQPFDRGALEKELSAEADRAGVSGGPIFFKLTLPQTESGALLQLLSMQQIDGSALFPGFDGVARVVRERVYWEGYEGTGGVASWSNTLGKRAMERRDKWLTTFLLYESSYNTSTESGSQPEYQPLRKMLAATRTCIDAGDYDPKLPERLLALEKIQKETAPKLDKELLRELTEVIAKLKSLQ